MYLLEVSIFTYIVFVIIRNRLSVGALIGKMPSSYNWGLLVLIGIGCIAYNIGATAAVMYPLAKFESEWVNGLLADRSISGSILSSFILLVILAPLLEETVFRGLLFSRLAKKWNMPRAMIISSLAFGVLHLNPIGAFVFGIVTCVLYVRTRTLLIPMALHALNNLVVWVLMSAGGGTGIDLASPDFLAQFAYEGLVAMMFGAPIVFTLLGRWWPSRGTRIPYEVNKGTPQSASKG